MIVMATKRLPSYLPRELCTPLEIRAIAAIKFGRVNYCPGTPPKRFARNIQGATALTAGQREYLWRIVHHFRRQIPDAELTTYAAGVVSRKGAVCG